RPASAVRKTVSWTRRHPGALAALGALALVALAFGSFYLFEENAFLRARQSEPTLARVTGRRHDALQIWSAAGSLAMVVGLFVLFAVRAQARGLPFKQWLDWA